jgi:hypothetical protein
LAWRCQLEGETSDFAGCPELRKIKGLESSKATRDIFTMGNGDNNFPLCMSFFAITEGFSYLA